MRIKEVCILGVVLMMYSLIGCGQQEIERLRAENESLKKKSISLEQEISKLKETADYHYKKGVESFSAKKFEEAKSEFQTVIEKYPTSSLISSAKLKLEAVKKKLAEIEAKKKAEERRKREEARK